MCLVYEPVFNCYQVNEILTKFKTIIIRTLTFFLFKYVFILFEVSGHEIQDFHFNYIHYCPALLGTLLNNSQ